MENNINLMDKNLFDLTVGDTLIFAATVMAVVTITPMVIEGVTSSVKGVYKCVRSRKTRKTNLKVAE